MRPLVRGDAPEARTILALFVLGLGLRWVWVLLHASSAGTTFPDEQQYWNLAKSLAAGRGLIDEFGYRATFMPLYPAFLSLFVRWEHGMLAARLVQAAIGAAAVIPIFLLANRLTGRRAAVASAVLVAIDPFLVFGFANLLLTETIFTTLLCATVCAAWPRKEADSFHLARPERRSGSTGNRDPLVGGTKWKQPPTPLTGDASRRRTGMSTYPCHPAARAAIAGAMFASAVYVRPSAAALVPAWAIVSSLVARDKRRATRSGAIVLATVILLLLPWAIRNRMLLGQWVWLTTRSGISLYDGLGPRATGGSDLAYTKTMPNVKGMSETEWDSYLTREAWRIARNDPARVLRLAWTKFKRMWSFVPNEPGSRTPLKMLASAAWMALILGTALAGAFRMGRGRETVLLLLPAVCFTLPHMVYVGSVRYRVPAMPLIYVLSGWTVARRNSDGARVAQPVPVADGAADG